MILKILENKIQSATNSKMDAKLNDKGLFQPKVSMKNSPQNQVNFAGKIKFQHPFPFDKFEGVQKGIPVFEGVSLSEIFFMGQNLNTIPLQRGCRNLCSHCFLSAEIPKKPTDDTINTIAWEDFTSLTSGVKELKQRLKKNFLEYDLFHELMALFLDSEQMDAKILDKNGVAHNAAEATKVAYDAFELPFLVDTTGWRKNDTWAQKTADELAKFFKQNPDALWQGSVKVSLNPFHSIIEKSSQLKKTHSQKSQKLRNIYVDRIANVLETFLECGAYPNIRVAPWGGHSEKFQKELNIDVLSKLRKTVDLTTLSPSTRVNFNTIVGALANDDFDQIVPVGRGASFFDQKHYDNTKEKYLIQVNDRMNKKQNFFDVFFPMQKFVDINGKVYAGNSLYKQDTGIQLNFINRDKKTPLMHNYFEKDMRFYNQPQD